MTLSLHCSCIAVGAAAIENESTPPDQSDLRIPRSWLQDELGTLLKEKEELKSKNECLKSQMNASRKPAASPVPPSKTPPDSALLKETANKLQAATALYQTLEEDMSKLKDANKTLCSQNIHLVQENLHLRAEVMRRSPQKFGRCTVAALESKVSKDERELTQLKKALKRSDAYIEELESQLVKLQRCFPSPSSSSEQTADCGSSKPDVTSAEPSDSQVSPADKASGSQKDTVVNFPMPSTPPTPSSVLDRLSLKSPVVRCEKKASCKRLPYLRRLSFDECGSSSSFPTFSSVEKASPKVRSNLFDQKPLEEPCFITQHRTQESQQNESLAEEAEMNAAYLNIVSELHCMLAEGDSSRVDVPQVPSDFHAEAVDPESAGEQQQPHGATDSPESSVESVKRKCPTSLATSSPTKLSRKK